MSNHPIVASIKQSLEASCHIEATTLFPSFLITLPQDEFEETRKPGTTMADLAIRYFLRLGLRCDRTRQDLYGYPGLLRALKAAPPWVEVTPEDTEALYLRANEIDSQLLVEEYRKHLEYQHTILQKVGLGLPTSRAMPDLLQQFREKLELARCLGIEQFEAIFHSVCESSDEPFDEFMVMPGVPDLFVWSESDQIWFFAEVKGPCDSLRGSQDAWVRANWETIRGRFALVLLHSG